MHGTAGLSMVTSETRVTMSVEERTARVREVLADLRADALLEPLPSARYRMLDLVDLAARAAEPYLTEADQAALLRQALADGRRRAELEPDPYVRGDLHAMLDDVADEIDSSFVIQPEAPCLVPSYRQAVPAIPAFPAAPLVLNAG